MKPLPDLTESELKAARRRLEIERSSVCERMISDGRGHELASETLAKAKLPDADALTLRFARVSSEFCAVISEEERRRTYHGSLKRTIARTSRRYAGFSP